MSWFTLSTHMGNKRPLAYSGLSVFGSLLIERPTGSSPRSTRKSFNVRFILRCGTPQHLRSEQSVDVWVARLREQARGGYSQLEIMLINGCYVQSMTGVPPYYELFQPMVRSINKRRLQGSMECFSYDFSSATDRWPLLVIFEMFQYLFGRSFSSAAVNSALATN